MSAGSGGFVHCYGHFKKKKGGAERRRIEAENRGEVSQWYQQRKGTTQASCTRGGNKNKVKWLIHTKLKNIHVSNCKKRIKNIILYNMIIKICN